MITAHTKSIVKIKKAGDWDKITNLAALSTAVTQKFGRKDRQISASPQRNVSLDQIIDNYKPTKCRQSSTPLKLRSCTSQPDLPPLFCPGRKCGISGSGAGSRRQWGGKWRWSRGSGGSGTLATVDEDGNADGYVYSHLRATGGEVGASSALAPKIGPLGLSPKKVGEDIAKATGDWVRQTRSSLFFLAARRKNFKELRILIYGIFRKVFALPSGSPFKTVKPPSPLFPPLPH